MSKGLKGITVTIDGNVTPLNQALSSVNANAKSLQTELKGVNSLLKLDPTNTDLLKQKQVILKEAVAETENKLKLLTQAQKEMAAAGKDINENYDESKAREIVSNMSIENIMEIANTFSESIGNYAEDENTKKLMAQFLNRKM